MKRMCQNFPTERLDGGFCHICNVRTSIFMLQDYITSMRSLFRNGPIKSIQLMDYIGRLVRKKFIENDSFITSTQTQKSLFVLLQLFLLVFSSSCWHKHSFSVMMRWSNLFLCPERDSHGLANRTQWWNIEVCSFLSKRVRLFFKLPPSNKDDSLESSEHTFIVQPIL